MHELITRGARSGKSTLAVQRARRFRDEQGWLNQPVAAACERVALVAAGLSMTLKAPH